jgi:hypothetical protein
MSLSEIGRRYKVSPQTVGRVLQREGLVLRGKKRTARHSQKLSVARQLPLNVDAIRHYRDQGLSTREMAALFGCSEEAVRSRMILHNIPRLAPKARPHKNYFWRGGRIVDKDGYILVKNRDHPHCTKAGYVREHRLLMEKAIGRYLRPEEVVDHIDGNPANNALENLRLYATNADHLRATIRGQAPKWTKAGRERTLKGVRASNARRRAKLSASKRNE